MPMRIRAYLLFMEDLYQLLNRCGIDYKKYDHPAVFTCAESEKINVEIPGAHTKHLFMRDKKKKKYVLAIVMHDKIVDTKTLGVKLKTSRLSFASQDDLKKFLNVTPGSVTPFGLMFDNNQTIKVIFDKDAWKVDQFRFHPLINTATLVINRDGFEKFMAETGHKFEVMEIPCN